MVLSKSGARSLLNLVRRMVETRRDYEAVKVDICNAFNECGRAVTIDNLQAEPSINYLAWLAAVILALETGLENGGGKGVLKA